MNGYRSLSITFRVGLAFHALNMEGTSGNVMEPRRIALGDAEYDGISGEIVRRHILEYFVQHNGDGLPFHQGCRGLDPARGSDALEAYIQSEKLTWTEGRAIRAREVFPPSTAELLRGCALCDVGGYLIADRSLKRDSTFEVGWLVSEHPVQADYAQHAAYSASQEHNLFTMGIRSGVYGGVMRFDLDRIGHNDWWWLKGDEDMRYPVDEAGRQARARALLDSARQWLLSPSGARQAGWLQHQGEPFEGVLVLSKAGPAPFVSPVALEVTVDGDEPRPRIRPNRGYRDAIARLAEGAGDQLRHYPFDGPAGLEEAFARVKEELGLGQG